MRYFATFFQPYLVLALLFLSYRGQAQRDAALQRRTRFCAYLKTGAPLPDSTNFRQSFEKAFGDTLPTFTDQEALNTFLTQTHLLLQKECRTYHDLVFRNVKAYGSFETLDSLPASRLGRSVCRAITSQRNLHYVEPSDSSITNVWLERQQNSTYFSRLSIRWVSDCEFEATFLESTHPAKRLLSQKGDTYRYRVLEKSDHYYVIGVHYHAMFSQFRLLF